MNSRTKYAKKYPGCCIVCRWWDECPGNDRRQKPRFRIGYCHNARSEDWFRQIRGNQACVLSALIPPPYKPMAGIEEVKP